MFHWTYKTYKACKTNFFLKELNLWLIKNTIGTVKISKTENEYHQWVWLDYSAWAILDISIVRNNFLETKLLLSLYKYVYIIENFIVSVIIYHSAVNGARSCLSRKIYALFYSIRQSRNIRLFQKNPNSGVWGYTLLKKPLGFLGL